MMYKNRYGYYVSNLLAIVSGKHHKGWGRKKSGRFALWCKNIFGGTLTLYEDGFIRSIGLGVDDSPSFSVVEDDVGIYYDAKTPSKLENILNTYNFEADILLMKMADEAMSLMREYHISKYNSAPLIDNGFRAKYKLDPWGKCEDDGKKKRVLIVTQTAGDASLEYGLAARFTTKQMIDDALKENPYASVYIKMHPDVLSGKKESDMNIDEIPGSCMIIDEDINTISLLKHFGKVYTKTSGMGMEALILGLEVICYGMPYYAGWGLTEDRQICERRKRKLSVKEVFAGAYILYTRYHNPYMDKPSNILTTIEMIVRRKK